MKELMAKLFEEYCITAGRERRAEEIIAEHFAAKDKPVEAAEVVESPVEEQPNA